MLALADHFAYAVVTAATLVEVGRAAVQNL